MHLTEGFVATSCAKLPTLAMGTGPAKERYSSPTAIAADKITCLIKKLKDVSVNGVYIKETTEPRPSSGH